MKIALYTGGCPMLARQYERAFIDFETKDVEVSQGRYSLAPTKLTECAEVLRELKLMVLKAPLPTIRELGLERSLAEERTILFNGQVLRDSVQVNSVLPDFPIAMHEGDALTSIMVKNKIETPSIFHIHSVRDFPMSMRNLEPIYKLSSGACGIIYPGPFYTSDNTLFLADMGRFEMVGATNVLSNGLIHRSMLDDIKSRGSDFVEFELNEKNYPLVSFYEGLRGFSHSGSFEGRFEGTNLPRNLYPVLVESRGQSERTALMQMAIDLNGMNVDGAFGNIFGDPIDKQPYFNEMSRVNLTRYQWRRELAERLEVERMDETFTMPRLREIRRVERKFGLDSVLSSGLVSYVDACSFA